MTPYYERDGLTLIHGEALAVLRDMPSASADAVITDPPYSSGGMFRGDRAGQSTGEKYASPEQRGNYSDFSGDNRDQRSFAYWSALWLSECLRIAKPGAPICLFSDWRQLPTATDALQAGGWIWRGVVVWDKTEGARPQSGRFRAQAEYVIWGSNGPMPEGRVVEALPGVFRVVVNPRDKWHLTGKPTELMRHICRIVEPGGTVLDPFAGSGSTGAGALYHGLRFIGIEIDAGHCANAARRLSAISTPMDSLLGEAAS